MANVQYGQCDWTDDDSSEEGKVSDEVGDQRTHVGVETEVIDKVEAKTTGHIVHLEGHNTLAGLYG